MLLHLKIKNIAVIEEADVEFFEGLNVLTGETGAGKSILIDSISMLTGVRSNRELIRTGEEKASVYGVFSPSEKVWKILAEEGIEPAEDGLLSVSRELSVSGKSVCKIAGVICPLSVLKKIGIHLINIHGQQDATELYSPEKHIFLLDKWCGEAIAPLIADYRESYKKYITAAKKNKEILAMREKRAQELEFFEYEINEILEADIKIGEEEALIKKRQRLKSIEKLSQVLSFVRENLYDSGGSAREKADISRIKLSELTENYPELEKPVEILAEVVSSLDDVRVALRGMGEEEFTEDKLEEIVDRLDIINKLKRKYGGSEESILEHLLKAQSKYEELKNAENMQAELAATLDVLKEEMVEKGKKLSEVRAKYGEKLSMEIKEQLAQLNMPDCEFKTKVEKVAYGGLGCDEVEFLISPNKGEDIKHLSKIASGGELSRIMLAIKCIMAKTDDAGTYIFDEIDTGVSGFAAQKVAAKLRLVGEEKQTLVITHSAHIASSGNHHFSIEKKVEGGRTKTYITPLDYSGRISEIARINAGSGVTEASIQQAKEMLAKY